MKSSDLSGSLRCEAGCAAFYLWSPPSITSVLPLESLREGAITQGSCEKPIRTSLTCREEDAVSGLLSKFSGVTKLVAGLPCRFLPTMLP